MLIYSKHSLLIIKWNEKQAYTFVQFSDRAKRWHFCTLIIVNISFAPTLDPKTFDIRGIICKRYKRL